MLFFRRKKERIEGDEIDLEVETKRPADAFNDYVPSVIYGIYKHGSRIRIGECDLRIGMNPQLYYAGNIGYRIFEPYRGHGYACMAAQLLLKIARDTYHMEEILVTCSPDNTPSRKTIEKLHAEAVASDVPVPAGHWLYKRGERIKNIYRIML